MKSFTDLSQSKVLAKILPIESADMWYHGHYSPWESERKYDNEPCPFRSTSPNWDKPCWSLAALLDTLLFPNLFENDGWNLYVTMDDKIVSVNNVDEPVDACYEMIIKLHEQKLL